MTPTTLNKMPPQDEDAELGFGAMLIVESEEFAYEPVSGVSTIREARFLAEGDFRQRVTKLENGENPMCPYRYVVWGRTRNGYTVVTTIDVP